MPSAMLRACAEPGCPELTRSTRCPTHEKARDAEDRTRRGSRTARGYDEHWQHFRLVTFPNLLMAADIARVCGAALPGGPSMTASTCKAQGRLVARSRDGTDLHLHHDPPLTDEERKNPRIVCDPLRVGYLCADDHRRAHPGGPR
jgi:hypothetical protein